MIKIFCCNNSSGNYYVWNSEDIYKLRKEHRIVGALVGNHPYKPGQVKRRHIPLKLRSEEVKLLLDKGICELHYSPDEPLDETNAQQIQEQRDKICDEQVELSKEYRKKEILEKCNNPDIAEKKSEEVKGISKDCTYFQIFTECPWKKDAPAEMRSNYPNTPEAKVKYAVFKDLWEKKFYITSGTKFGGDFLVYAGDPFVFHAVHIVVCLPPSKKFHVFDIIVNIRLANQVKKNFVYAFLNESQNVEYISMKYVPQIQ